jgi:mitochondrial cardiolipin hydrolase
MRILILIAFVFSMSADAKSLKNRIVATVKEIAEEKLIPAPKDNEVCFSPVERCDVKLSKFIESAEKSLDVAVYDINNDMVVHQILVKSKKIPVRVIVDRRQSKGQYSAVHLLKKAGVNLRYGKQRSIFHHKFTIVDGLRIQTGSFNYTFNATKNNNENQVYLATPEILSRFITRFDEMWIEAHSE